MPQEGPQEPAGGHTAAPLALKPTQSGRILRSEAHQPALKKPRAYIKKAPRL